MKATSQKLLILLCLTLPQIAVAQQPEKEITAKKWWLNDTNRLSEYLYSSFDTLHFAPGERIADIGAQYFNLEGILSMYYQHLDITAEDIDTASLNQRRLDHTMNHFAQLYGRQPVDINCHIVPGNDSSTTLPDNSFQKVFLLNTYHEITKQRQMIADLYRITSHGGVLYVSEQVTSTRHLKRKDCGHIMPIERELLQAFEAAGYKLLKIKVREGRKHARDHRRFSVYQFGKD